jgi:hypothetical protein
MRTQTSGKVAPASFLHLTVKSVSGGGSGEEDWDHFGEVLW